MASWSTGASAAGGVDATYGQRSVFGAVGRGVVATAPAGDADLECEDEQAALAYLAGVQAEARKIPHVVLAPAYGPQAFPPRSSAQRPRPKRRVHAAAVPTSGDDALESSATINKKRRRRRRLRHWDELDDGGGGGGGDVAVGAGDVDHEKGNGRTSKRRRMAAPAAAAAALSYDDDGGSAGADTTPTPTSTGGGGYSGRTVRTYDELDTGSSEEETDEDDEDDDDDDDDAYEPQLDRSLYDNGVGDARGYYQDGAYIAAAADDDGGVPSVQYGPELPGTDTRDEDATAAATAATAAATAARFAAAYRARLLAHFAGLRALLRRPPPPAAVAALPPGHDTAVGTLSARSGVFRRWLLLLQTTDPLPAQVAALDTVAVLRVLRVLQRGGLLQQQQGGAPRTSRWLWALLARLPARGELDHRAVGCLRDVAKQAVQLLAAAAAAGRDDEQEAPADETALQEEAEGEEDLDDLDIAMDLESLPDEEDRDGTGQGDEDKAAADAAAAAASEHEAAADGEQTDAMQQRATLEMVLAVVGEFYGQRDLLAFRAWP